MLIKRNTKVMSPHVIASTPIDGPSIPQPRAPEILPETPSPEAWKADWLSVLPELERLRRCNSRMTAVVGVTGLAFVHIYDKDGGILSRSHATGASNVAVKEAFVP